VLRAGARPARVTLLGARSAGPPPGGARLQGALTAGLIGTIMVVVFMLVYYQLSGAVAIAALALNLLYVAAAMPVIGATLTLPGIAGLVLTVGMAVDTNVLVFERIRRELRNSESVRRSVQIDYHSALRTVLCAHS